METDDDIIEAEFIDTTPPRPAPIAVAIAPRLPTIAIDIPGRPMPPDAPEPRA